MRSKALKRIANTELALEDNYEARPERSLKPFTVVDEVREYLYRYGSVTSDLDDPVDLLRRLFKVCVPVIAPLAPTVPVTLKVKKAKP